MRIEIVAGLALCTIALPATAQTSWQDQVVTIPPAQLLRALQGTWYEVDPGGTPHKSLFSPGIKGCARLPDGEFGGDISLRQSVAKGFETAWLGGAYEKAMPMPNRDGPVSGIQFRFGVIHMLTPAPDGTPRIHISGSNEKILHKCPVRAP